MKIRTYTDEDAPHLESLLHHIWGNDPRIFRRFRFGPETSPGGSRYLRTVVAEARGRPVGFGTSWTNPFHPYAFYVSVNVHPAMRRMGIGTHLLNAVADCNAERLPLQGSTWETSIDGIRFLERHGFSEVRRTWEPTLHVADVDLLPFDLFKVRCSRLGYALVDLNDLADRPDHEEKLANLIAEGYTATHGINPPRQMELPEWIDTLRRDPPAEDFTFVALQDKQYVAISAAHGDESDGITITWNGVTAGHRQHERDLMHALTLGQVFSAARQGLTVLQGEFDSTNPWAMLQLGAFPFRPAPGWVTYRRNPEG